MHFLEKVKQADPSEVATFKGALQRLAETPRGGRNEALSRTAYMGGCLVGEGVASEDWVGGELLSACDANGYVADSGEDEVLRVIATSMGKGRESIAERPHENPIYDMVLSMSDLDKMPPAAWLVDDLLLENSIAFLVGDGGVGKSFMAIDLAARLATKSHWHGKKITNTTNTVYMAGEGLSGLNNRRMAWEKFHKTPVGNGVQLLPQGLKAGSSMWDAFVSYVGDTEPGLVVIDTLSRTAGGLEENTPSEMASYIDECDRLRIASGGTVLVLHHTGKSGDIRGATSIRDNADTVMFLNKTGPGMMDLYINKQKDGYEGDFGEYRLKNVKVGTREDGKPIESAVFIDPLRVPWERG